MPEIFSLFGYSFYFYSRDHLPIHVHVEGDGGYAVFDWDEESKTFVQRECYHIKGGDLRKIRKALETRRQEIFDKWNEHFNRFFS